MSLIKKKISMQTVVHNGSRICVSYVIMYVTTLAPGPTEIKTVRQSTFIDRYDFVVSILDSKMYRR